MKWIPRRRCLRVRSRKIVNTLVPILCTYSTQCPLRQYVQSPSSALESNISTEKGQCARLGHRRRFPCQVNDLPNADLQAVNSEIFTLLLFCFLRYLYRAIFCVLFLASEMPEN